MTASETITKHIGGIKDWRGKTFATIRKVILSADKEIVEDWKWMGSPVWSRDGMIAVANAHKGKVKLTFAHGAHVADPKALFNDGFNGNERRSIDIFEKDKVNEAALKALVKAAIVFNQSVLKKNKPKKAVKKTVKKTAKKKKKTAR
jgi:hypothetical protein